MEFCVTRKSGEMVAPSWEENQTQTQIQTKLPLSVIDKLPVLRCNARTLHVYSRGGGAAAQIIRSALSKALVSYYPLAGRLITSSDSDQLQIDCSTVDGIWFVEAMADCALHTVNYFEDDFMSIPYDKLLPSPPPPPQCAESDPLVQMQVTEFECGGFVIGLIFCHSVCDGLGSAQFLNAVGEIARGALEPTISPKWCRDFLPNGAAAGRPPPPPIPIPSMTSVQQLEHAAIDVSSDRINELKREFRESTGGMTCSTFELVAALLWRQRTRAIINPMNHNNQPVMRLVFFANCRGLIRDPPLPQGFYGNCFFPVTLTAASGMLIESSIIEVVKLIQQAKLGLPNQFAQWVDSNYCLDPDPFAPPLEYNTLFISEWGRLGFNEVDFGWGGPVHVIPIQGSTIIPVGIVCSKPRRPNDDSRPPVRLMTWCVHQSHIQPLLHHMANPQMTFQCIE